MRQPNGQVEDLSEFDGELADEALDRCDGRVLCICGDCNYGARMDAHGD